jgi:hypothetical protein
MEQRTTPILTHALSWLSLGVYLLSFSLPTIELGLDNVALGGRAFVLCFLGSFLHTHGHNLEASPALNLVPFLAWAANPLFWWGAVLVFRSKWRRAAILGLAATAFASAFAIQAWWQSRVSVPRPIAAPLTVVKPGGTKKVVGAAPPPVFRGNTPEGNLLVGYYVWWLSMALLAATGLAGACAALRRGRFS